MERRLAAILAADVVGYSRLMQQDEAGTLAALTARRKQILEPLVAKHHGRIPPKAGSHPAVDRSWSTAAWPPNRAHRR